MIRIEVYRRLPFAERVSKYPCRMYVEHAPTYDKALAIVREKRARADVTGAKFFDACAALDWLLNGGEQPAPLHTLTADEIAAL